MEEPVPDIDQWIPDSFPSIVIVDIVVVVVGLHLFLLSWSWFSNYLSGYANIITSEKIIFLKMFDYWIEVGSQSAAEVQSRSSG